LQRNIATKPRAFQSAKRHCSKLAMRNTNNAGMQEKFGDHYLFMLSTPA
jgi:hypothetical protein